MKPVARTLTMALPRMHAREVRLLGLVLLNLVFGGLYLDATLRGETEQGSGWRRVDLDALRPLIEAGDLRDREADWYHPEGEDGAASGPGRHIE